MADVKAALVVQPLGREASKGYNAFVAPFRCARVEPGPERRQ